MDDALRYVQSVGGLQSELSYPYSANNAACTYTKKSKAINVKEIYTLPSEKREDSMADYLLSTGPMVVCVDASTWSSYTGMFCHFLSSCRDFIVFFVF